MCDEGMVCSAFITSLALGYHIVSMHVNLSSANDDCVK